VGAVHRGGETLRGDRADANAAAAFAVVAISSGSLGAIVEMYSLRGVWRSASDGLVVAATRGGRERYSRWMCGERGTDRNERVVRRRSSTSRTRKPGRKRRSRSRMKTSSVPSTTSASPRRWRVMHLAMYVRCAFRAFRETRTFVASSQSRRRTRARVNRAMCAR